MKQVTASMLTYDASVGRVEPGQTYSVEDDKAERWIQAGIATESKPRPTPPQPDPPAEPEEDDEEDDEEEEQQESEDDKDPAELAAEAHKLHDAGDSERTIAQKMGIPRTRVHTLLAR